MRIDFQTGCAAAKDASPSLRIEEKDVPRTPITKTWRRAWKAGAPPLFAAILFATALSGVGRAQTNPGSDAADPAAVLTLRDALAISLEQSPRLAAFSYERRAREADVLQASRRPNPELSLGVENFGGSGDVQGFDRSELTLALSQTFELGGKRSARTATAQSHLDVIAWEYEIARAEVLEQTTRAFVDLLAAQQHLTLADELVEVAEEALASIARRVEAGATSPVEQSRAQVELEISRIERTRIAQMLATRRSVLASIWGDDAPRFGEALGDLESVPEVSSLEDLQHRVSEGPAIVRWSAERKRRESELAWQRSQGTPNLSMGAGVRYLRESEDTALIVELGLPLPIFDRNRDAVRAAALRLDRLDGERSAAVAELQSEVSEAYGALRTAADEAEALRSRAIPPAEVAFQAAREASLRGAMRFTDVLDTERMLFELRGRYYDALADLHTAHANLERILGAPILPHASGSEEDPR